MTKKPNSKIQQDPATSMSDSLRLVLTEMCNRVGVSIDDIDFKKENWYWDHTWTTQEQDHFKYWLANLIRTNRDVRTELSDHPSLLTNKRHSIRFADMFILNYGWKTED